MRYFTLILITLEAVFYEGTLKQFCYVDAASS
jgi:hypothetical protein